MAKRYRGRFLTANPPALGIPPNKYGISTTTQQLQAIAKGVWPADVGVPTIGTATAGNNACASVTFTAPSKIGYPAPVYTVTSTPGNLTASGSSSPLTVTGLSVGTSYTFKVRASNAAGYTSACSSASNSVTAQVVGSQSFIYGTFSWVVPANVTSISVVTVGGGGGGRNAWNGGAGAGAGLAYVNNISVTPGETLTVIAGCGGRGRQTCGQSGAGSYLRRGGTNLVGASGGGGAGGAPGTSQFGTGGAGGYGSHGGGGAGGYSGSGGNGGSSNGPGAAGSGGGSGGGGGGGQAASWPLYYVYGGAGGGGTGLFGIGSNGAGGSGNSTSPAGGGGGGSGGGGGGGSYISAGSGGVYGGGGGVGGWLQCNCCVTCTGCGGDGGPGGVRIMWPGNTRSFPSTNASSP